MRNPTATQFAIEADVKDELDRLKSDRKEEILGALKKTRRQVTNSDAIKYLLMEMKRSKRLLK